MAIRMLENFAGVMDTDNLASAAKFGDYSASLYVSGFQIISESGKKWLKHNTSGTSNILLNLAGGISSNPTKLVIGFRVRRSSTPASSLVMFNSYPAAASHTYSWAAGQKEAYFEIELDRSGSVIVSTMYVDRVQVGGSITWSAGNSSAIKAGTGSFYLAAGSYTYLTDFYLLEDTNDDTPCDRLGPQNIVSIDMELSSNAGWNIAALTEVLARTQNMTDTGTRVNTTAIGSELKLRPKAGVTLPSQVTKVNGILVKASVFRNLTINLETTVQRGSRSDSKTTLLPGSAANTAIATVMHLDSSKLPDEYAEDTALDQVEVVFKAVE